MTREDVVILLETYCRKHGTQKNAAKNLGVSPAYLNDVLLGRREPGAAILRNFGLRRVVSYEIARD